MLITKIVAGHFRPQYFIEKRQKTFFLRKRGTELLPGLDRIRLSVV